ncbi:bifunctional HhH-GPD domain/DNA glycosylase/Helix-hairpin-helix [Babesia duncani]|uniref:DNA-(apurinic or apyrimidinic site) lyase n=1 Tax=Babesia duncani TaxID=323732 RepID=A0AAD9PH90_9APIC|nr:bifunctional HhH-GPD domain/DNA glycosylase/Helix-hairpin-helix [Babesia duncani]
MKGFQDLGIPPHVLRPSLLLDTGQAFSWRRVGKNNWVGVIDSTVYEIEQNDNSTLYKCLYGTDDTKRLRHYFDLDHEYQVDSSQVPKIVSQILKRRQGIRILNQDLFECIISFICSANNNIKRITKLLFTLRESYGTFLYRHNYGGIDMDFYAFPTLSQLQTATREALEKLGFGYRARYLADSVNIMKSKGPTWLDKLKSLHDEDDLRLQLMELPGIGRKVADCIMLFGLERRDVVPVDVHILKIAQGLLGVKNVTRLNDKVHRKITQAFRLMLVLQGIYNRKLTT